MTESMNSADAATAKATAVGDLGADSICMTLYDTFKDFVPTLWVPVGMKHWHAVFLSVAILVGDIRPSAA